MDRILARGASDRASDIHLEPTKHCLRVRFRIDGMMHEVVELLPVLAPVVARLKVLGGMDIAVHRNPQDGRFSATINGKSLDVRTSTYPTIWGEKAVLRLLDRSSLHRSVSNVMSGHSLQTFRDLIRRTEGFVVVTGPTGSGKTSTLYRGAGELAESGKNVVTIEDPGRILAAGCESGTNQQQGGLHVAEGLRAILRQDRSSWSARFATRPQHRHRSLADRTSRALDAPHQRLRRHVDETAGNGRRAVSPRLGDGGGRRPAPGAQDMRVNANAQFRFLNH